MDEREAVIKLWSRTIVDQSSGCWLITEGFFDKDGYARVYCNGRTSRSNRFSAYIFLGLPLDSKLQANHKRECTNKNCWNPDHLYTGTQSENRLDSIALGTSKAFGGISEENKGKILIPNCIHGHGPKMGAGNRCLVCKELNRNRTK